MPTDDAYAPPPIPTGGSTGPATSSFGGSGLYGQNTEPTIFFGYSKKHGYGQEVDAPRSGPGGQGAGYDAHVTTRGRVDLTAAQALAQFDAFSRKDFLHFRNLFVAAGLVGEGADPMTVRSAYESLLGMMPQIQASGHMISPAAYLNNLIRMNGLDPSKIGSAEDFSTKAAAKPWTKTQTSVYDLSPEDARASLEDTMTKMLGRAPTEDEIHDFINAAQTAAKQDPTTATATFTPGDTGLKGDSQDTTTDGGVTTQTDASGTTVIDQHQGFDANDVARMAENRAKNAPDYAEYQATALYFPALMSMLGATTGG